MSSSRSTSPSGRSTATVTASSAYGGAPVPKKMNQVGGARRAIRGFFSPDRGAGRRRAGAACRGARAGGRRGDPRAHDLRPSLRGGASRWPSVRRRTPAGSARLSSHFSISRAPVEPSTGALLLVRNRLLGPGAHRGIDGRSWGDLGAPGVGAPLQERAFRTRSRRTGDPDVAHCRRCARFADAAAPAIGAHHRAIHVPWDSWGDLGAPGVAHRFRSTGSAPGAGGPSAATAASAGVVRALRTLGFRTAQSRAQHAHCAPRSRPTPAGCRAQDDRGPRPRMRTGPSVSQAGGAQLWVAFWPT